MGWGRLKSGSCSLPVQLLLLGADGAAAFSCNPAVPTASTQHLVRLVAAKAVAVTEDTLEAMPPPKDSTYSLLGVLRGLLARQGASPTLAAGHTYDRMASRGGVWRTLVAGIIPMKVLASPAATASLNKAESRGDVVASPPRSMARVVGPTSILSMEEMLGREENAHARRWFLETLGPREVLKMCPLVEKVLDRFMGRWAGLAKRAGGQVPR